MNDFEQSYDRIIGPIEDRMIRAIWRIAANAQDAEDALQDALLVIWKRWSRVLVHPSPQALILKICIDAAYDATRRKTRQHGESKSRAGNEEPSDPTRSPFEEIIQAELYAEVLSTLHRLSRHQRTAIVMRVCEGLPYSQIAAAMGCMEATARKHVARARKHLKEWLSHLAPDKTTRN